MKPTGALDHEKANPTLSTMLEIEGILEHEATSGQASPLSISEIERRMAARRTRRDTIKTAIAALVHYGVAAVGTKGVIYVRAGRRTTELATAALA